MIISNPEQLNNFPIPEKINKGEKYSSPTMSMRNMYHSKNELYYSNKQYNKIPCLYRISLYFSKKQFI